MSAAVAAIIPSYNRADLVGRAVESALSQRVDIALEVVVVDDHSTDETAAVLGQFGDAIRVVATEQNVERGAARNVGAGATDADLLAFLDSDDEWRPGKLARQLPLVSNGVACVTGVEFVDVDGRRIDEPYVPPLDFERDVRFENRYLGGASSLMITRRDFERAGGYANRWAVQGSEDWLLLVEHAALGGRIEVVPEPLVGYCVHSGNSTLDPERNAVSMWLAAREVRRRGYVAGLDACRLSGRSATIIARGYASCGRFEDAAVWTAIALRRGTAVERLRALTLTPLSVGAGVARRAGVRTR